MEMSGALRTQAGAAAGAAAGRHVGRRRRFVLTEQCQQVDSSLRVAAGAQCSAGQAQLLDVDSSLPQVEARIRDLKLRKFDVIRGLARAVQRNIRRADVLDVQLEPGVARREFVPTAEIDHAGGQLERQRVAQVGPQRRGAQVGDFELAV